MIFQNKMKKWSLYTVDNIVQGKVLRNTHDILRSNSILTYQIRNQGLNSNDPTETRGTPLLKCILSAETVAQFIAIQSNFLIREGHLVVSFAYSMRSSHNEVQYPMQ